MKGQPHMKIKQ